MKRVDLKKILYMDFLIRHKCTGTSKEFAAKMDMSRFPLSLSTLPICAMNWKCASFSINS